jgi:transposase
VFLSQEALSKIALDLEDPWYVKRIDFSAEEKQLDIYVDFRSGSKYPCAKCGKTNCSVHDTIKRTWRHSDLFQFKTYIHCRVPRTKCEDCGVKQVKVPWARKSGGFTLLMDSLIVLMAKHMTATAIAEMIDEHDTRILRVLKHYAAEAGSKENQSKD